MAWFPRLPQALDYSAVRAVGDRLIDKSGGVLARCEREARGARRWDCRWLRIIGNDSVRQISILLDNAIEDGLAVWPIAEHHQGRGPVRDIGLHRDVACGVRDPLHSSIDEATRCALHAIWLRHIVRLERAPHASAIRLN